MFEQIIQDDVRSAQDPEILRFCATVDQLAKENLDSWTVAKMKANLNTIWNNLQMYQKDRAHDYLVASKCLGWATEIITDFGGRIQSF